MQNKQIDGLANNHSLAPLPKQEQMRVLNAKKMKSSYKIDLRDLKDGCVLNNLFKTPIFFGIQNKNFTCLNGC
jgi:hypothetical protein